MSDCSRCFSSNDPSKNRCEDRSKYWSDGRKKPDPNWASGSGPNYFGWRTSRCEYFPNKHEKACSQQALGPGFYCGRGPAFSTNCQAVGMGEDCKWAGQGKIACNRNRPYSDYQTEKRIMECCFGTRNDNGCNPVWCPGNTRVPGTDCYNRAIKFCGKEENFFGKNCRTWLKNLGTSAIKDQVAREVCPKYADSTDLSKKNFCACYNAEMPEALKHDPVLQGQVLCLSQACQHEGLIPSQHYGVGCDLNYVVCKNEKILQELHDQGTLSQSEIKNECGITIGGETPETPDPGPGPAPTTDTEPEPDTTPTSEPTPGPEAPEEAKKSLIQQPLFWGAILFVLCLILVAVYFYMTQQ